MFFFFKNLLDARKKQCLLLLANQAKFSDQRSSDHPFRKLFCSKSIPQYLLLPYFVKLFSKNMKEKRYYNIIIKYNLIQHSHFSKHITQQENKSKQTA